MLWPNFNMWKFIQKIYKLWKDCPGFATKSIVLWQILQIKIKCKYLLIFSFHITVPFFFSKKKKKVIFFFTLLICFLHFETVCFDLPCLWSDRLYLTDFSLETLKKWQKIWNSKAVKSHRTSIKQNLMDFNKVSCIITLYCFILNQSNC